MRSRPEYIAVAERSYGGQLLVLGHTVTDRMEAHADERVDNVCNTFRVDCPKRRFCVVRLEVTGSREDSTKPWEGGAG